MSQATQLFVSDLDGTLLRSDGTLSDFSRAALTGLLTAGLAFTVASARSVVSMQAILGDLPLALPVIEFNGAFLSDFRTGRHLVVNALDPMLATDIYHALRQRNFAPFVSTFDGTDDCLHCETLTNDGASWYWSDRERAKDRRLRAWDTGCLRHQIICLTTIGREADMLELEAVLREIGGTEVELHCFENAYSPGWWWLTVHDRRATKDQAIRLLVEQFGFGLENLVVFGDQINDLKMFQLAPVGVAVADAVPELKAIATQVIGPADEDSVAKFLLESVTNSAFF